jgi:hypothetical protein
MGKSELLRLEGDGKEPFSEEEDIKQYQEQIYKSQTNRWHSRA